MRSIRTDFSGIWPLVEEYLMGEKAKKFGYRLQKDRSKTEKMVWLIKEITLATNNLKCFLLSAFIVVSDWKTAISILSVFGSLQAINKVFTPKK